MIRVFELISSLAAVMNQSYAGLHQNNFRLLITFHYTGSFNINDFLSFSENFHYRKVLVVSDVFQDAIPHNKVNSLLGEEYECILFDARNGLGLDSLGIVTGLLKGGGGFLLMLPELSVWDTFNSCFYTHVKRMLEVSTDIRYIRQYAAFNEILEVNYEAVEAASNSDLAPYRTSDQKNLVEKLDQKIASNKDACCVIASGRGRGKSSSLGLLAAKLIKFNDVEIIITAPRRATADPFFRQLHDQLPEARYSKSEVNYKNSRARFMAPDLLLDELPVADVVIIDEAAAIPVPMLEKLLDHYQAIVFSTTTHGYEGTGRGFVLKFYKLLDANRESWNEFTLNQPIRWSDNDPLERWVNNLLFLNVKLDEGVVLPENNSDCKIELVDREELVQNSDLLSSIFSLLVFAHYRTSPSDFEYLLDSEKARLYVLTHAEKILGVLLISEEGGFTKELSTEVYRGERRPRGNLLAQTLCFHAGSQNAAQLKYARVMRIAIHPEIQNHGLGSYFLNEVIDIERTRDIDVLGSSFSSNVSLLKFWESAGLTVVRMGFSRDHVSASHSAVVALGMSKDGKNMVTELEGKFYRNLSMWEEGPLSSVSEDIKKYLHAKQMPKENGFLQMDKSDVESFANANRNYEACMPAILRCIASCYECINSLAPGERELLHACNFHKSDWKKIVETTNMNGKSAAISKLRIALQHLLVQCEI